MKEKPDRAVFLAVDPLQVSIEEYVKVAADNGFDPEQASFIWKEEHGLPIAGDIADGTNAPE